MRVDLLRVVAFGNFADLQLVVSSLVVGDEGESKMTGRWYLHHRISELGRRAAPTLESTVEMVTCRL